MNDKIVRIALKNCGFAPANRFDTGTTQGPVGPPPSPEGTEGIAGKDTLTPGKVKLTFSWQDMTMEGWKGGDAAWPVSSISFNFPETDLPRVRAWYSGNYAGVTEPAGATLINNVSDAVEDILRRYFTAAGGLDLFTSPFRLGWALRRSDGTRRMCGETTLMTPNRKAPLVAALTQSLTASSVSGTAAVINMPKRLLVTATPADLSALVPGDVTHIDIVAAPQVLLMPDDIRVTGIGTVSENGVRYRCYTYNRPDEQQFLNAASIQNDFRIIASIPVAELAGAWPREVPVTPGALANWKLLEKYKSSAGDDDTGTGGDTGGDTTAWEPWIDRITGPIDFGMPEHRKWLRSLIVRGVYDRRSMRVRVYGSQHREGWRLLADGARGWIGGMAMAGYRYFRVRVTGDMRRGDFIDAITFRLTRIREWRALI